ncbi:hypothetical protein [Dyadobacter pollutisoli]|uniref:Uncharacterized protein n=1 Tax=Dyadobacter pollutisoli TaxID=2910158 RepID=A0A9E8N5K4_9BACT|nr:hypothetical protein [Dyadobacter pollutisoli]WAC10190.1 hypothetical protein ON006_20810 [Dyadobacter pollutisoli]
MSEHLIRKGQLKITLYNLEAIGALTSDLQDRILDELAELDRSVEKLSEILKVMGD